MPSQTEKVTGQNGAHFDIVRGFAVYECPDTPVDEIWIYTVQRGRNQIKVEGPITELAYNRAINQFMRENPDQVIDFVAI